MYTAKQKQERSSHDNKWNKEAKAAFTFDSNSQLHMIHIIFIINIWVLGGFFFFLKLDANQGVTCIC